MGALLSSASLLLAIVAVLYGLWYKDIEEALYLRMASHDEDQIPQKKQIINVLKYKARPLALITTCLALIYSYDMVSIIVMALRTLIRNGLYSIKYYSAANTAFTLITFLMFFLSYHMIMQCFKLKWKVKNK